MSILEILFWVLVTVIVLPALAYMIMKFGTAGVLRAKQRELDKRKNKNNE